MADETTRVDAAAAAALAGPLARSEDDLDPLVGTMVGSFRVDAVLGRGGMGVVYRAWDVRLDRAVALKTVQLESRGALMRFRREAKAQAKLRHRNVVPVHLIDEQHGLTYLVMDLVDGGSLRDLLAREGPLDEARALDVVDGIAAALSVAQEHGLVHRDVKPSNVLVERDGHVLLADFGLARTIAQPGEDGAAPTSMPRSLRTMGVVGTPAYLSPEQMRGESVDHRSDMYALGVTLYELVTGARPPAAVADEAAHVAPPPPSRVAPELSPAFDAFCIRLLAFDPDDRFATYAELRAALASAREALAPVAPLWLRPLAFAVDFLVLGIAASMLALAITRSIPLHGVAGWFAVSLMAAGLEHAFGTTIGKRLFGLAVVSTGGERPSLPRALLRNAVKWSPLYVGILFLAIAERRAGFLVVALAAADALPVIGRARATLHDLVAKTRVVRRTMKRSA